MKLVKEILGAGLVLLIIVGLVVVQSCKKDDDDNEPACTKEVAESKLTAPNQDKIASDLVLIEQYLAANEIDIADTQIKNNVRYRINELGTGETPCIESNIKIKYRGRLMHSGYIFDPDQETQRDVDWQERELTYNLSSLITGWQIVLPSIPVGSKLTLYIPSGYGYGTSGSLSGSVPVNANLIFDIELLEIVK
ncbi:MAG: FKBP-type peptidyl-prolyl cis-trans isomerase [Cyclobacteriaceae bacterium]|nr:FKBP-type peptidyl-prolyl cis-trans isomerase [Cyclobacteriaceae bacterium]